MENGRKGERMVRVVLVLAIALSGFVGLSSVVYLWQKNQNYSLGKRIRSLELEHARLERRNERLRQDYAFHSSPPELAQRIADLGLDMGEPEPGQILRIGGSGWRESLGEEGGSGPGAADRSRRRASGGEEER